MGTLSRFKYVRARPYPQPFGFGNFYSYHNKNMRLVATEADTWADPSPTGTIFHAYIPPSTWAQNKIVLLRWVWTWNAGGIPMPPAYSITEYLQCTGGGVYALPGAGTMNPAAASGSGYREALLWRLSNKLFVADRYQALSHEAINDVVAPGYWQPLLGSQPDSFFANEIELYLTVSENFPWAGAAATTQWSECLVEQGVNLGSLA